MDIDGECLGIPETEYNASITMNSNEFSKVFSRMQCVSRLTG